MFDHAPAIYLRNTGSQFPGKPCLGSWVTYGLGTENQNLPAFVVMSEGSMKSGPPAYGAGFLPAVYQGTAFRSGENPVLYLKNPRVFGRSPGDTLGFITNGSSAPVLSIDDSTLEARMFYELAVPHAQAARSRGVHNEIRYHALYGWHSAYRRLGHALARQPWNVLSASLDLVWNDPR